MKFETVCRGFRIELLIERVGADLAILILGGSRPHIGCAVLAVPRPSLNDPNRTSCTSSVLNCIGHKEEEICRSVAERICCEMCCTVVCSGGVHLEHASSVEIEEIKMLVFQMMKKALAVLSPK